MVVHCNIYKSSYIISNIAYFNSHIILFNLQKIISFIFISISYSVTLLYKNHFSQFL
jgi:hypothetical protein